MGKATLWHEIVKIVVRMRNDVSDEVFPGR